MDDKVKNLARMGMMAALAMIAGYIEVLIPFSVGISGIKLGLANIIIVFALYYLTEMQALGINVVRILLVNAMFGNPSMMIYSLAGGLFSFGAMYLLKKSRKFSIYGVSIAGGIFHNIGQLLVAMMVLETRALIYYIPALLLSGLVTGLLIGIVAQEVKKRMPKL